MTDITIKDIEHWRCEREKTSITFSTLKREFTSFKALMNTAKKTHLVISSHQLESYTLKPPTDIQESRDVRYLTESEEFRLRNALDEREKALIAARDSGNQWREARGYETLSPLAINGFADHLKPIVLLALNTGLRRGDLFTLEWEHINFEHRHIRKLINKTKKRQKHPKPAILPLSTEALDILSRWKPKIGATGYVFKSPVTGLPFDNINKAWRQIVTNAKIESFRFHDLRHTFASRLVMAGVPLNTVRELMTHSKPEMTLIYSHLSPDHKASAIEKVFG
jgi:integrase